MEVIQERNESGDTIDTYCQSRGISRHAYYYWQRKLREVACKQLAEQGTQQGIGKQTFTEIRMLERKNKGPIPEESNRLHIEVAGVRIVVGSGYPVDKLTTLVRELMGQ
jgi:transposase-like protein